MPTKSLKTKLQNSLNTLAKRFKNVNDQFLGKPKNKWRTNPRGPPPIIPWIKIHRRKKRKTVRCKHQHRNVLHLHKNSPYKTDKNTHIAPIIQRLEKHAWVVGKKYWTPVESGVQPQPTGYFHQNSSVKRKNASKIFLSKYFTKTSVNTRITARLQY